MNVTQRNEDQFSRAPGTGARAGSVEPRGRADAFLDWFAAIGRSGPTAPFSPPGGIDAYRGAPWLNHTFA